MFHSQVSVYMLLTSINNVHSSEEIKMVWCKWRGIILFLLFSWTTLSATSVISQITYSIMAAKYIGTILQTCYANVPFDNWHRITPTAKILMCRLDYILHPMPSWNVLICVVVFLVGGGWCKCITVTFMFYISYYDTLSTNHSRQLMIKSH